jgi:hypothetical protein
MVQVANMSANVQRFTQKDGSRVAIEPGEALDVSIDRDDVRLVAKERARLVSVGGTKAKAARTARRKTPVAPADDLKE